MKRITYFDFDPDKDLDYREAPDEGVYIACIAREGDPQLSMFQLHTDKDGYYWRDMSSMTGGIYAGKAGGLSNALALVKTWEVHHFAHIHEALPFLLKLSKEGIE